MVRYALRYQAYWMMLTSAYPKGLFGDSTPSEGEPAGRDTRPLRPTDGAKWLLIIFIIVGVLAVAGNAVNNAQTTHRMNGYSAHP